MTAKTKRTKKAAPKTAPTKGKAKPTPKAKQADAPSKPGGPVAKVWAIADGMKDREVEGAIIAVVRKDVLAACLKAGININTAKTQFQRWLHRGDK